MAAFPIRLLSSLSMDRLSVMVDQEKRLNVLHMRCLKRILGIAWQDRVTNKVVLEKAGILSLYTLLKQRRMRWLEHV